LASFIWKFKFLHGKMTIEKKKRPAVKAKEKLILAPEHRQLAFQLSASGRTVAGRR
jgi:hypothetical protein